MVEFVLLPLSQLHQTLLVRSKPKKLMAISHTRSALKQLATQQKLSSATPPSKLRQKQHQKWFKKYVLPQQKVSKPAQRSM
jgi:hypothetical protein